MSSSCSSLDAKSFFRGCRCKIVNLLVHHTVSYSSRFANSSFWINSMCTDFAWGRKGVGNCGLSALQDYENRHVELIQKYSRKWKEAISKANDPRCWKGNCILSYNSVPLFVICSKEGRSFRCRGCWASEQQVGGGGDNGHRSWFSIFGRTNRWRGLFPAAAIWKLLKRSLVRVILFWQWPCW